MNSDDPWIAYARTIVEISPPGRATLRVLPAPKGQVGTWPAGFRSDIFVITAWNPYSQPLDDNTNRVRQEALEFELRELETWPAVGLDPELCVSGGGSGGLWPLRDGGGRAWISIRPERHLCVVPKRLAHPFMHRRSAGRGWLAP
jgi:hypothetical protein